MTMISALFSELRLKGVRTFLTAVYRVGDPRFHLTQKFRELDGKHVRIMHWGARHFLLRIRQP